MTNITAKQIIEQVTVLAQERPDFIYTEQEGRGPNSNGCGYAGRQMSTNEGEGCIVGQALSRLGLSEDDLLRLDEVGGAASVCEYLGIKGTNEQYNFLSLIQGRQDGGYSWGAAFADAKAEHPQALTP